MREIEVKVKIEDLSELENRLKEKDCVLSPPINQHDVIYSLKGVHELDSRREGKIILRIRNQDGEIRFTLKKQKSNESDNIEYETIVDDAKELDGILRALGWRPEIEVKKIRRKGKIGEYEICLDNVEGLGAYVEMEKLTDENADPAKVQRELLEVLESFGVDRSGLENRAYYTIILQLENKRIVDR